MHGRRLDRARLLRLAGAAAAAPFAFGVARAGAAIADEVIPGRNDQFLKRAKRGDFAWYPTWGGGYYYVPRRVLTTTADAGAVLKALRPYKAQRVFDDLTASAFKSIGVVELALAKGTPPVPQVLAKAFPPPPADGKHPRRLPEVAPHYVTIGEPQYEGGPFGPPAPASTPVPYGPKPPSGGPHVAVIDTGYFMDQNHADLDAHVVVDAGAADMTDLTLADGKLDDEAGHGTFIAGLIVRLAPTATVEIVKVLDGLGTATEGRVVAKLLDVARRKEVNVVNMSLGVLGDPQFPPVALTHALAQVQTATAIVACAGNNHTNQPMYPAAFARVVGVGAALDSSGAPAPFSNYGPWVDCYAPGVDLTSAFTEWTGPIAGSASATFKGWAKWSGTSFAAPKVSGKIASMIGPTMTAQQAADALVHDPTRPFRPDLGRFLDL